MIHYVYTGPSGCAYKSGSTVFGGVNTRGNLVLYRGRGQSNGTAYFINTTSLSSSYPFIDESNWDVTSRMVATYNGSILYSSEETGYGTSKTAIFAPQGTIVNLYLKTKPYNRVRTFIPSGGAWPQPFSGVESGHLSDYECTASGVLANTLNTYSASSTFVPNEYYVETGFTRKQGTYSASVAAVTGGFYAAYSQYGNFNSAAFPTAYTMVSGMSAMHFTFPTSTYPIYKPKIGNYTQYAYARKDWYGHYEIQGSRTVSAFGSSFATGSTGLYSDIFGPDVSSCVVSNPNSTYTLSAYKDNYQGYTGSSKLGTARIRMIVP